MAYKTYLFLRPLALFARQKRLELEGPLSILGNSLLLYSLPTQNLFICIVALLLHLAANPTCINVLVTSIFIPSVLWLGPPVGLLYLVCIYLFSRKIWQNPISIFATYLIFDRLCNCLFGSTLFWPMSAWVLPHAALLVFLFVLSCLQFLGRPSLRRLTGAIVCIIAISLALRVGNWVTEAQWFAPSLGLSLSILPIFYVASSFKLNVLVPSNLQKCFLILGLVTAYLTSVILPGKPISSIVFDEAHGKWESTLITYDPEDFGRNHSYQYTVLARDVAPRIAKTTTLSTWNQLPSTDSVFIIKMPTEPISRDESHNLYEWVSSGGRLLIICDHTDLYDHAQILNGSLGDWTHIKIDTNATFDIQGRPNLYRSFLSSPILGQYSLGADLEYMTGTTFQALPWSSYVPLTFGLTFSELGDYSSQNRFGTFKPTYFAKYGPMASAVMRPIGEGAVMYLADSTPWSNFSIFKSPYKQLFVQMMRTLEFHWLTQFFSPLFCLLFCLFVLSIFSMAPCIQVGLQICVMCLLTLQLALGKSSPHRKPNRANDVLVTLGEGGTTEFLPQLVPLGGQNYSRIISSLGKFGFSPTASRGEESDSEYSTHIWIHPNAASLPSRVELLQALGKEGKVILIFPSAAAGDRKIAAWLRKLDLELKRVNLNGRVEAYAESLVTTSGIELMRQTGYTVSSLPESALRLASASTYFQVFKLRGDLNSGLLAITFFGEQFSDDAISDVWEGVYPTSNGSQREAQFARLVRGEVTSFSRSAYPIWIKVNRAAQLKRFYLLEDGHPIGDGELAASSSKNKLVSIFGMARNPDQYLSALQEEAIAFTESTECHAKMDKSMNRCTRNFISQDSKEWRILFTDKSNVVNRLELISERGYSSLSKTYNIIFERE